MPRIVPCRLEHFDAVLELLSDAGLPAEGLRAGPRGLWVAQAGAEVVGAVGLEVYGAAALLRSLVVREDRRRSGVGASLVRRVMREAARQGARTILLLTAGAEEFFRRFGFEPVGLDQVPDRVRQSPGFRTPGARAGVCMRRAAGT
jgi:N-acetylglutamate synthase-like GNAT family acetyltransferase